MFIIIYILALCQKVLLQISGKVNSTLKLNDREISQIDDVIRSVSYCGKLLDHYGFDVGKLPDAEIRQLAPIAAVADASEGQAGI